MSTFNAVSLSSTRGPTFGPSRQISAAENMGVVLDELQKNASRPIPAAGDNRAARRQQEARRDRKESLELRKNGGVPKGDPAGNFVMAVATDPAGSFAMSVVKTAEAVKAAGSMLTDTAAAAWESLPGKERMLESASENLAWAGGQLWNACEGAGSLAMDGVRTALQFRVGLPGAEGAQVSQADAGQCKLDAQGQCAGASEEVKDEPVVPSLSRLSQKDFKKAFGDEFKITLSKSLRRREDKSMSNVLVIPLDSEHHRPEMQQMLNDVMQRSYETGDKYFAEWSAATQPPPVFCRGVPAEDCIGVDDPVESGRLRAMGSESIKLAKTALSVIAKYAPGQVNTNLPDDYGQVKRALLAACERVTTYEIYIPASATADVRKLQTTMAKWNEVDAKLMEETNSKKSFAIRDTHMGRKLSESIGILKGHKGYFIPGWDHKDGVLKELDEAGVDYMLLEQKTMKDLPPFSREGLKA